MFGVLIESKAKAQRRAGGALLSVMAHTAVLSLAVVLTAQGSPSLPYEPPPKITPVTLVPLDTRPTERGGSRSTGPTRSCECPVVPPLPNFTVDGTLPPTDIVVSEGPGVPDASSLWGSVQPLGGTSPASSSGSGASWTTSETSARILHAARPRYPEMLRAAGVSGRVLVRFVIDTVGRVDPSSLVILQSTHDLFSRAVRDVMPAMRLIPAEVSGRRVPMLAEMSFEFALDHR